MITATALPIFPICPTYGFSSRPDYLVKITTREGGYEKRDRKWSEPLHYYDGAPMGPAAEQDIEAIASFYHAMGGLHQRFLFKDFADFKSCYVSDTVSATDQAFVDLGGGAYQLVKTYTVGSFSTIRTIRHPKGDTIVVSNNGGVPQADTLWTVDEDTGILTTEGGFTGTPGAWGGEFYVPCRFDGELRVEIVEKQIMSLGISIKELRPDE